MCQKNKTRRSQDTFPIERYKFLSAKFDHDNDHKWNKLYILLMFDTLLLVGIVSQPALSLPVLSFSLCVLGFLIAIVWVFNVGRTIYHQKYWRGQIEKIEDEGKYPEFFIYKHLKVS